MLVSALVAGASVWLALSQLGFGMVVGSLGGVAFGALALVLERVTVVSLVGHGGRRVTGAKRVLSVLPQVVFGFITAIVISVPLVLAVFRPEIEKQLVVSQLERTVQIQEKVDAERRARRLPLEEDLATTTDPAVRDNIRRRLDQIDMSAAQTMDLSIADVRDSSDGLLARLEALSELRASNATLDTAVWTLVGMFALISFLPTLLASMQRIQPANAYHLLIHVREQYVPRERELDELRKQIRVVSDVADREDVDLPVVEILNARLESLTETVNRDKQEVLGQVIDLDARRIRNVG
ncbi:hypothetical protein GCM10017774_13940 [Lentzea cavernae]|uniref:DUF4407 domain-containing protein n=2 Tax=Lentzea cavernae TaxID=2020703 RepID=A0ABQ3M3Y2_9PSEU|nr:hypothetical protein GCM10017774_13940 [Lentzea cavernae]